MDYRLREFVTYVVLVSYNQPNTFAEVTCKHNLELSIISIAPLSAEFLEIASNFQKCQNAPFEASFWEHDQVETDQEEVQPRGAMLLHGLLIKIFFG